MKILPTDDRAHIIVVGSVDGLTEAVTDALGDGKLGGLRCCVETLTDLGELERRLGGCLEDGGFALVFAACDGTQCTVEAIDRLIAQAERRAALHLVLYAKEGPVFEHIASRSIGRERVVVLRMPFSRAETTKWLQLTLALRALEREAALRASELQTMVEDRTVELECRTAEILVAQARMEDEVCERRRSEAALKESEARYHTLARVAPVGIFRTDAEGRYTYVNEKWCQIVGLTESQALGQPWWNAVDPQDLPTLSSHWTEGEEGHSLEAEFRCPVRQGNTTWVLGQAAAERDDEGNLTGYIGTLTDITERKRVEEQLRFTAFHDVMTGLPNRSLLMQRLEACVERRKCDSVYNFAVLFLDLDRFKVINDSLGHQVGDELLKEVANRLKASLRSLENTLRTGEIMMARLGGDEFVVLVDELASASHATVIAQRVHSAIDRAFHLRGHEVFTSTSVGIATGDHGYHSAEEILRDADTAMYCAKASGSGEQKVFDRGMHQFAMDRLQLETDLRKAVANGELSVAYQPIVNARTGRIVSFEALVRWNHPTRGPVSPDTFIGIAEETGLIYPLGLWVLETACLQICFWKRHHPAAADLAINVNVSARQFVADGFLGDLDTVVQSVGIEPRCLRLEITESVMLEKTDRTLRTLEQIRDRQIGLHLDDFGTGYSSLSHLRALPLDGLKIDKSFVKSLTGLQESAVITRSLIDLAHSLGFTVTAEGVEYSDQLAMLRNFGCDTLQGYLLSRPLTPESAEALLASEWCYQPESPDGAHLPAHV